MVWSTLPRKIWRTIISVLWLYTADVVAQTRDNQSLLDTYLESADIKLYASCSHGDYAVWGYDDIYAARRKLINKIGQGGTYFGGNCLIKFINNDNFWLDRVHWSDPSALYRQTKGAKTLLTCEYGFKVFGKGYDQREALRSAVTSAKRQGLTNCRAPDGRQALSGKPATGRSAGLSQGPGTKTETYNIDLLQIKHTYREASACATGLISDFELTGVIGPDSTFAMTRLLERNPACRDASGRVLVPHVISLNSNGGLLDDGYALGRELRRLEISAVIGADMQCASSCAVAFLGGTRRVLEGDASVMFHAPYFSGENSLGKRDISCDVGEKALAELRAYYQEMTDAETGDRLFERTMWYCSADDGWVVKGASAAELRHSDEK